jgi:hypothetical protein
MLEFLPQDGIEIYASDMGFICFKSTGDLVFDQDEHIIKLTIGQFRAVIKNADALIAQAEQNKALYKVESK